MIRWEGTAETLLEQQQPLCLKEPSFFHYGRLHHTALAAYSYFLADSLFCRDQSTLHGLGSIGYSRISRACAPVFLIAAYRHTQPYLHFLLYTIDRSPIVMQSLPYTPFF